MKKWIVILVVIAAVAGIGGYAYWNYRRAQEMLYPKFYSGNGRLEATEIYVSSKLAGRIEKIFVKEGDLVKKGDKLVQMQTSTLEAEKAATLANIKVQEGELAMARATVKLKESAFSGAEKEFKRQSALISSNAVSQRVFDEAETKYNNAKADLEYARANVIAAEGRVAEQKAELQRIEADLADSTLVAAYDGRIQYLLAHEGEVLSAGGRVMNLVNLTGHLHDLLSADEHCRQGSDGGRGEADLRRGAPVCDQRPGHLHRPGGPVYAEKRGDPGRAGKADVPHQGQPQRGKAAAVHLQRQNRPAGRRLGEARSGSRLAERPGQDPEAGEVIPGVATLLSGTLREIKYVADIDG